MKIDYWFLGGQCSIPVDSHFIIQIGRLKLFETLQSISSEQIKLSIFISCLCNRITCVDLQISEFIAGGWLEWDLISDQFKLV